MFEYSLKFELGPVLNFQVLNKNRRPVNPPGPGGDEIDLDGLKVELNRKAKQVAPVVTILKFRKGK